MIDGDSASASEIFAGAIQDSGRGKIVGTRSYGKGSVQGIFALGTNGAGARLTTARFFSPLGHPISNVGITPDVDVRRATPVVAGAGTVAASGSTASSVAFQTGFRGTGTGDSASLANADAPSTGAAATPAAAAAVPAATASPDPALDIAIEVVRLQPVAQL
jgi:carboxyl-terminal processing protease